jgi:hypothetical protein
MRAGFVVLDLTLPNLRLPSCLNFSCHPADRRTEQFKPAVPMSQLHGDGNMKTACKIVPVLVSLLLPFPTECHPQQDSPVEVVELFSTHYGSANMDQTAKYTTEHFRDNRPKSVWIVDTWKTLQQIEYKRLQGSVIGSKIKDNRAAVILDARIGTAAGETNQKEIYYLIKQGQKWLIDRLQVTDEDVNISAEKMKL